MFGPLPVLTGKRKKSQTGYARANTIFYDGAGGLDTGPVASMACLIALFRPSPVTIHDDRNVAWQLSGYWLVRFHNDEL